MESWNVQVAGDVDVEPRVRMRGPLAGTQNAAQRDGARFSEQDTAGVAEVDRRTGGLFNANVKLMMLAYRRNRLLEDCKDPTKRTPRTP